MPTPDEILAILAEVEQTHPYQPRDPLADAAERALYLTDPSVPRSMSREAAEASGDLADRTTVARQNADSVGSFLGTLPVLSQGADVVTGIGQGVRDIGGMVAGAGELVGIPGANEAQHDLAQESAQADADRVAAGSDGFTGRVTRGIARTITGSILPGAGGTNVARVAGTTAARLAPGLLAFGQGANQADIQAENAGMTGWDKAGYIGASGAAEAIPTYLMPGGAEAFGAGKAALGQVREGLVRAFLKGGAKEIPEEEITALAQAFIDQKLPGNEAQGIAEILGDYAAGFPERATISGIVGGGSNTLADLGKVDPDADDARINVAIGQASDAAALDATLPGGWGSTATGRNRERLRELGGQPVSPEAFNEAMRAGNERTAVDQQRLASEEQGDPEAAAALQGAQDDERAGMVQKRRAFLERLLNERRAQGELAVEGDATRAEDATDQARAQADELRSRDPEAVNPELEDPLHATLVEQLRAGTTSTGMRARLENLLGGLGAVETVRHEDATGTSQQQREDFNPGERAVGPQHHQKRLGTSPFVDRYIERFGAENLPSLQAAIRRASTGRPVAGKSFGEQHLLDEGYRGLTENPYEAGPPDMLLADVARFPQDATSAPPDRKRGGRPAPEPTVDDVDPPAAGLIPDFTPAKQPPSEPVANGADVTPAQRAEADTDEGAAPAPERQQQPDADGERDGFSPIGRFPDDYVAPVKPAAAAPAAPAASTPAAGKAKASRSQPGTRADELRSNFRAVGRKLGEGDEYGDAAFKLLEARAASAGESTEDYIRTHFRGVGVEIDEGGTAPASMNQRAPAEDPEELDQAERIPARDDMRLTKRKGLEARRDEYRRRQAKQVGADDDTAIIPAARGDELHQEEQPRDAAFRAWFKDSKVVDKDGKPLRVYHGLNRSDRFGPRIIKKRATSGPAPYFTDSPEIASKYSDKADNSLEAPATYVEQFVMKIDGRRVDIERAWNQMTPEQRAQIAAKLPHVTYENRDEGDGPFVLGDSSEYGLSGKDHWDYNIRQYRGNVLRAAVDTWLDSGALFNSEHQFIDVLRAAGITGVVYNDPQAQHPGIIPVYLSIQNPLDVHAIPETVLKRLELAASRQRRPAAQHGADHWDKARRDAHEWAAEVRANPEHAFTSIPDWATKELASLGYDGVQDTGGKMGGDKHGVWIPFEGGQIKSAIGNRGTFDGEDPNILHQTAWHGGPHEFDRFDMSKIGTGEGAQAYGWGLYFAGAKAVAKHYRERLSDQRRTSIYDGRPLMEIAQEHQGIARRVLMEIADAGTAQEAREAIHTWLGNLRERRSTYKISVERHTKGAEREKAAGNEGSAKGFRDAAVSNQRGLAETDEAILAISAMDPDKLDVTRAKGRLFKVDLKPRDDEWLRYDQLGKQQPARVREAIGQVWDDMPAHIRAQVETDWNVDTREEFVGLMRGKDLQAAIERWAGENALPGQETMDFGGRSDQAASVYLLSKGIRGVKYIDGNNRNSTGGMRFLVDGAEPLHQWAMRDFDMINSVLGSYEKDLREALMQNAPPDVAIDRVRRMAQNYIDRPGMVGLPTDAERRVVAALDRLKGRLTVVEDSEAHNYVVFSDSDVDIEEFEQRTRPLNKSAAGEPQGKVNFNDPDQLGRALITILRKADVSTLPHELGHVFRRDLRGADLETVEKWAGVKNGKWTKVPEEKWADAWERYLRDGRAPTAELKSVFARFSDWFRKVYARITGTRLEQEVPAHIRKVMDRLLTPGASPTPKAIIDGITGATNGVAGSGRAGGGVGAERDPVAARADAPAPADAPAGRPELRSQAAPGRDPAARAAGLEASRPDQSANPVADTREPGELANYGETRKERNLVEKMDKDHRPGVSKQADVRERALAMLDADYDGTKRRLAASARAHELLGEEDTFALQEILAREARQTLANDSAAGRRDLAALHAAFRGMRTEQARSLAIARDRSEKPAQRALRMAVDSMLTPPATMAKAIGRAQARVDKARVAGRAQDIAQAQDDLDHQLDRAANHLEKVRAYMRKAGVNILYQGDDTAVIADIINHGSLANQTAGGIAREWWISMALSGPRTLVTNAIAVNAAWQVSGQKMLEGMVNVLMGRSNATTIADVMTVGRLLNAKMIAGDAVRNFAQSWSAERAMFDGELQEDGDATLDVVRGEGPQIRGGKGRVVRSPLRGLMAADQFNKTWSAHVEVAYVALRRARAEGLTGAEREAFVEREMSDHESGSWAKAKELATEHAFQQSPGRVAKGILEYRNMAIKGTDIRPLFYIFPFVKTPSNILTEGLTSASVFGAINFALKWYQHRKGSIEWSESQQVRDAGKALLGFALQGLALAMAFKEDEDGEPMLTGSQGSYRRGKDELDKRRGMEPYSIRFPGTNTRFSYAKLEPFATALGISADIAHATKKQIRGAPIAGLMGDLKNAVIGQAFEKSYLTGMHDMFRAIDPGQGSGSATMALMQNFTVSWIPNLYRQVVTQGDDVYRDGYVQGQGVDWFYNQGRRTLQRAFAPWTKPERVSVWGETITKTQGGPSTTVIARLLRVSSPVTITKEIAPNDADRFILAWNEDGNNAGKKKWPYLPSSPSRTYTGSDGVAREFTEAQYDRYQRLAGKKALDYLRIQRINLAKPTEDSVNAMAAALSDAREWARSQVLNSNQTRSLDDPD